MPQNSMPTLAHVLSPFPYHIDSQASPQAAKTLMNDHDIHHLVVMADNDIYGLLSEQDLRRHSDISGGNELSVADICSERAAVADIHDPLDKVLEAMIERQLGSVVVLREGELAGIFTKTDACRHFYLLLQEHFSPPPADIIA